MNCSIKLHFKSHDLLADFLQEYQEFLKYKARREKYKTKQQPSAEERPPDRWSPVREIHANAKKYQEENPDLPYRECLKAVATNKK